MRSARIFWVGTAAFVILWAVLLLVLLKPGDAPPAVATAPPVAASSGADHDGSAAALASPSPAPSASAWTAQPQSKPPQLGVAGVEKLVPDEEPPIDEYAQQYEEIEKSHGQLRSSDPDARIDAIGSLVDLDPQTAERELDSLLQSAEPVEDVRVEAFEKMEDLAEGRQKVDFLIRSLRDRSPKVREEAAWKLSFEDEELYPKIVTALHGAFEREHDPDALNSMQSALEDKDPNFVSPDAPVPTPDDPAEVDAMASVTSPPN
jgi:hypothetical protein